MNIKYVAPKWARILIIPAVVLFFGAGVSIIAIGTHAFLKEKEPAILLILLLGLFFIMLGYRGIDLVKFRNTAVHLDKEYLFLKKSGNHSVEKYSIESLSVVDKPCFQMAYIYWGEDYRKLLAIDYHYSYGVEVVTELIKLTK